LGFEKKLQRFNFKISENLFFRLRDDVFPSVERLKEGIWEKLELLIVLFMNNFAKLRVPHLVLDVKRLESLKEFKGRKHLLLDLHQNRFPYFSDFIGVLKRVIDLSTDDFGSDSPVANMIRGNGLTMFFRMQTDTIVPPTLKGSFNERALWLFRRYTFGNSLIRVSETLTMFRDYRVIPSLFTAKNIVSLFMQVNIRVMKIRKMTLDEILDEDRLLEMTYSTFILLLSEIGEWINQDAVYLESEGRVELLLQRYFRE